ncbi:MAG: hypothetical protein JKY66_00100 [Spongiibacteraceae bacterium]|nr:hypothetical protein [Spongiibacteraceae bacterium]
MLTKVGFGLAGLATIGCLVVAVLWQMEKVAHAGTIIDLAEQTMRADTATKAANKNAALNKELELAAATAAVERKHLNDDFARANKERDAAQAALSSYRGRILNAATKKPGLISRLANRATTNVVREFSKATCRSDCGNSAGGKASGESTPSGHDKDS